MEARRPNLPPTPTFTAPSLETSSNETCGYCNSSNSPRKTIYLFHGGIYPLPYEEFITLGYRRSSSVLYRHVPFADCCPKFSIRLPVRSFVPSSTHKRDTKRLFRYLDGDWPTSEKTRCATIPPHSESAASHLANTRLHPQIGAEPTTLPKFINQPVVFPQTMNSECVVTDIRGKYHHLTVTMKRSSTTKEGSDLFVKYQCAIHHDSRTDPSLQYTFRNWMCNDRAPLVLQQFKTKSDSEVDSIFFAGSYHLEFRMDGTLFAISSIDLLPHYLSSLVFIYDPDWKFLRPGFVSMLFEIDLVRAIQSEHNRRLEYWTAGLLAPSNDKMAVKDSVSPSELLCPFTNTWIPLSLLTPKIQAQESYLQTVYGPTPPLTIVDGAIVPQQRQIPTHESGTLVDLSCFHFASALDNSTPNMTLNTKCPFFESIFQHNRLDHEQLFEMTENRCCFGFENCYHSTLSKDVHGLPRNAHCEEKWEGLNVKLLMTQAHRRMMVTENDQSNPLIQLLKASCNENLLKTCAFILPQDD
ncbi:putative Arginyl-tRNA--protein transferase [Blattamonas nauphoetae]|uniref:arginyltransferase n=1 Tax=Blattamonas nauphoetae TaxID=2049346 RepID=A0ABQ9XGD8_9EUKA|nr:putative Arginyl-tRNA--protein transferase [Blattamonas nauphoetae]